MTPILANVIESAFSPLIEVFQTIMVFIHNDVLGSSWGLSIIGLTVVVRAVMLPLTFKQFHSMQRLQLLMPEMKQIQERYKEDKQRQQQEMMKFYQENKINPFASCLPLVLQLPVFISLFYMLRADLKKHICGAAVLKQYNPHHGAVVGSVAKLPAKYLEKTSCEAVAPHSAKFLFIPDITNHASGVVLAVLIVLYVGSQLGSTLLMSATAERTQRIMMIALPFVFVLFIFKFPAGLLLYWITTNLWTVIQQFFIRRRIGKPPAPEDGQDAASGGGGASGGAGKQPPQTSGEDGGGRRLRRPRELEPALAGPAATRPPRPPRKKKKRSGKRR
ncbi:MAG: YidC/Oxa1 family membrane protein insertase [Solirubrobacteraceae bacterium]